MFRSLMDKVGPLFVAVGVLLVTVGGFLRDFGIVGGGIAALAVVGIGKWRKVRCRHVVGRKHAAQHSAEANPATRRPSPPRKNSLVEANNTSDLVEGMIRDGRFALLLRPQIVGNLEDDQIQRAIEQLEQNMVLVPSGPVCVGLPSGQLLEDDEADYPGYDGPEVAGRLVMVEPLFLDRHCVTNREFQRFVDAGGYEQMALWDEEALPAMLDFVDRTGQPGPRYWRNSTHPKGEGKLPVVGVSWYEAAAYARWCGKRLPTDAEWTKAGSWPVESSPGHLVHRRYPWGDAFDSRRANVWAARKGGPVAVDAYEVGVSVGGNHQLIGNVWEWTSSNFGDPDDYTLRLPVPMRSIRGGAFDTYFENQSTCHYQSGDSPLSRKHNIGFRLALGTCDVAPEAGAVPYEMEDSAALAV